MTGVVNLVVGEHGHAAVQSTRNGTARLRLGDAETLVKPCFNRIPALVEFLTNGLASQGHWDIPGSHHETGASKHFGLNL